MERRSFNPNSRREITTRRSMSLEKKLVESRRPPPPPAPNKPAPDITDFMNDMFFGVARSDPKAYNLTGNNKNDEEKGHPLHEDELEAQKEEEEENEDEGYLDSPRSTSSSKLTQEWLEEAKKMVAMSPSRRCESPKRLVGSPRFGSASVHSRGPALSLNDRKDPLSRSARRHRSVETFSGEILLKSAKHTRNRSETLELPPPEPESPVAAVHRWFANMINPHNPPSSSNHNKSLPNTPLSTSPELANLIPPRPLSFRRSRFQNSPTHQTQPQTIPPLPRRTFKTPALFPSSNLLSPPKNLVESAHRRSISSTTCSSKENLVLSPPRNLVQSNHRRTFSASTCSIDRIVSRGYDFEDEEEKEILLLQGDLNGFLKKQRGEIGKIVDGGDHHGRAKIVLSGSSNSTSSMVAAIAYAWLLESKMGKNKADAELVVPVMNVRRGRMWKHRQAAWLFHHVGIDTTALLFSDEVDLENLMVSRHLSILVVGEDILRSNGEVGSQCTVLTDNYCEDAYDLLQTPLLKKLLLAGILLDTQNLNASSKLSMTRDAEAVQLLLVGSAPNYRNTFFDQLVNDYKDASFLETMRLNYGKPPAENARENRAMGEHKVSERKPTNNSNGNGHHIEKKSNDGRNDRANKVSPKSAKPKSSPSPVPALAPSQVAAPQANQPDASRGKNKFFLAKWFGFGSK